MNIDIIGLIYEPTGVMLTDSEGGEYPEMHSVAGWHVNTVGEVPEWLEFRVTPTIPRRIFAGVATYFYSFPSEEVFSTYYTDLQESEE